MTTSQINIDLAATVGKGYGDFWRCEKRYRVLKGSRGSKKSTTTALWYIYHTMKFFHVYGLKPYTLVIRRFFNTHRNSTFAQLQWAINRLGVRHLWKATGNPLELVYKPSGQKIIFNGLDDSQSLSSMMASDGHLCWVWFEEAFQCGDEDDFNKVDLSIRGELPAPLFKQLTLTFNPWLETHWLKKRFFDRRDSDVYAETKNYDINEFLGEDDIQVFEKMKVQNPKRYWVEGLGNWGVSEGLIYDNWTEMSFSREQIETQLDNNGAPLFKACNGIDLGYSTDPTAVVFALVSATKKEIYIYDEIYKTGLSTKQIFQEIAKRRATHARFVIDRADPRLRDELKAEGIKVLIPSLGRKKDIGIRQIQDYQIYVDPTCAHTVHELSSYRWATSREGILLGKPIDENDHIMDALRYALEEVTVNNFEW